MQSLDILDVVNRVSISTANLIFFTTESQVHSSVNSMVHSLESVRAFISPALFNALDRELRTMRMNQLSRIHNGDFL